MREAEVYRKREDEKKEFTLSSLLLEPTVRIHKYLSYFRVRCCLLASSSLPPQFCLWLTPRRQEILAYTPKDHPDYENLDSVSIHLRQVLALLFP